MDKSSDRSKPQGGSKKKTSIDSLVESLSSDNGALRERARKTLVASGKTAVPPLILLLNKGEEQARWEAAKALGDMDGKDAAEALVGALDDESRDVRWVAAEGLISMRTGALEPLLRALLSRSESIWVRRGATHVIHELLDGENVGMLSPVLIALEDEAPVEEVAVAAYDALEAVKKYVAASARRTSATS
jgi:HEAT repeat protein